MCLPKDGQKMLGELLAHLCSKLLRSVISRDIEIVARHSNHQSIDIFLPRIENTDETRNIWLC